MNNSTDYPLLIEQVRALIDEEPDPIAALGNACAVLFHSVPDLNWLGIYRRDSGALCLGPFQGKVACTRIPWGQGVCGVAAATGMTQRVANVHDFDGHIACDSDSMSELVVPIVDDGNVIAVLDIDSPIAGRFDATDQSGFERIALLLTSACRELID